MKQVNTLQGPFWVFDQDHLGQVLASMQWWDGQIKPVIDAADHSGWALDLGASVGWFTCYLASLFTQVVAVEMHPSTFGLLQRNIGDRPNVTAHNLAAYDQAGYFSLADETFLGWPCPADLNQTPNASSVAVLPDLAGTIPGGRLDDLLPRDAPVTFIKCDVQGCDLRALKGLDATIMRCHPTIVFEYESGPSSWHRDSWVDYVAFFTRHGYGLEQLASPMDWVAYAGKRPEFPLAPQAHPQADNLSQIKVAILRHGWDTHEAQLLFADIAAILRN